MRTRLVVGAAVVALAGLGPLAGPAAAATDVGQVAESLADDRLFLDPGSAEAFTSGEADQLRERLTQAETPVYLAVLPDADGDTDGLPDEIRAAAGRPGTYAVVAGTRFHATSTVIGDRAGTLAAETLEDVSAGAATTTALLEFVDAVELAASQGADDGAADTDGTNDGDKDDGGTNDRDKNDGDKDDDTGVLYSTNAKIIAGAALGGLVVGGLWVAGRSFLEGRRKR